MPPDHHSSCLTAATAARWLSRISGCHPFSQTVGSLPGAKNAKRSAARRSSSESERLPALVTAVESSGRILLGGGRGDHHAPHQVGMVGCGHPRHPVAVGMTDDDGFAAAEFLHHLGDVAARSRAA